MLTSLAMIWKTSGKMRMPTFSRSQRLMMLTSSPWLLSGRPTITSSTSCASMMRGMSAKVPSSGTPSALALRTPALCKVKPFVERPVKPPAKLLADPRPLT